NPALERRNKALRHIDFLAREQRGIDDPIEYLLLARIFGSSAQLAIAHAAQSVCPLLYALGAPAQIEQGYRTLQTRQGSGLCNLLLGNRLGQRRQRLNGTQFFA